MGSNTFTSKPDWLTEDIIADLKHDIAICPVPYTQEEVDELQFDGSVDVERHNAFVAIKILTKYNIPFETTAPK